MIGLLERIKTMPNYGIFEVRDYDFDGLRIGVLVHWEKETVTIVKDNNTDAGHVLARTSLDAYDRFEGDFEAFVKKHAMRT